VASDETSLLIDAGLSYKETARRLGSVGVDPAGIQAVCITHEHDDHTAGLGVLQRKLDIPVYANAGTIQGLQRGRNAGEFPWQVFTTGAAFAINDLTIEPFSVPHDAYDPVGFVIRCGTSEAGIVTDMGMATGLIRERLKGCGVMVLESNHDEYLLKNASRPWPLKQRIAGRQGHLSNEQTGELLAEIAGPHLAAVFLAHLSVECNRPELAMDTVRKTLEEQGHDHVEVKPTFPDRASEVFSLP